MRFALALLVGIAVALSGVLSAACNPNGNDGPGPEAWKSAVAAANAAGLPVYWLGRSFEAGGVEFSTLESQFPAGIRGVALQGIEMSYFRQPEFKGRLDLNTYSQSDWSRVAARFGREGGPGQARRTVTVAGHSAELISTPAGTRPVNGLSLVVDFGGYIAVAETSAVSSGNASSVPDRNPLLDEETFLSVLEELRPYPQ